MPVPGSENVGHDNENEFFRGLFAEVNPDRAMLLIQPVQSRLCEDC